MLAYFSQLYCHKKFQDPAEVVLVLLPAYNWCDNFVLLMIRS
jgi:hypothetical protein